MRAEVISDVLLRSVLSPWGTVVVYPDLRPDS